MPLTATYTTGAITVAANGTTVTGSGVNWLAAGIRSGDVLAVQGLTVTIDAVTSATSMTLAATWPGAALSASPYEIRYTPDASRVLASSREAIAAMESLRGDVFVSANVYASSAAGLAATEPGQQFQTISVNGKDVIRYRHDAGGVATEVARYPTATAVTEAVSAAMGAASEIAASGIVRAINTAGSADAITADFPAGYTGSQNPEWLSFIPAATNSASGPSLKVGGGFIRTLYSHDGSTLPAGRLVPGTVHVVMATANNAARVMAFWTPPGYIDQRLGPVAERVKTVSAPALRRSTEAQSRVHDLIDLSGGLHLTGLGGKSVQEHITTTQRRLKELARAASTGGTGNAPPARVYDAVHDIGCDPNGMESVSDKLNAFTTAILNGPPTGPVTIFFPRGRYRANTRIVPRTGLNWVGVGPQSIIMPAGTDAAFHNLTSQVYIKGCIFANLAVDGQLQTLTAGGNYNVGAKAFYIQGFRDCLFTDLYLYDTGATALGIDFADRSIIQRVRVQRGGRLAQVGDLGGSGIGIGTGWLSEEPLIIADCLAEECRNYGIFLERQHGSVASHTIVHHNIVRRNQYGIGGCGTSRTIYDGNQISDNLSHGLTLHRGTNNASQADDGAIVTNNQIYRNGGAGVDFDPTWRSQGAVEGFQAHGNRIEGNAGPGYRIQGPELTSGNRRRGISIAHDTIIGNGGHGIEVAAGRLHDFDVDGARIVDNSGSAVHLAAEAEITGGSIRNVKARDHRGTLATQTGSITGGAKLTDFDIAENHGVGCAPIDLTGTQTRVTFGRNPGM